jgi:hypothetical protein
VILIHRMGALAVLISLLVVLSPARAQAPAVPSTPAITWQEAIAELAAERTRAVACAARARGRPAATAERLGTLYAEAKAEIDAVIAGLAVVLAQGGPPVALPELQQRLRRGFDAREEFCRRVIAAMPAPPPGQRSALVEMIGAVVGPLIEAATELYKRGEDRDTLRRNTIRAQLEAQKWPDYSAVPPSR